MEYNTIVIFNYLDSLLDFGKEPIKNFSNEA